MTLKISIIYKTQKMETEIWKPIKEFEGMYEVSNLGEVRTVERTIDRKSKKGKLHTFPISSKIKTPNKNKFGYITIALVKENKTYNTYLHRIIAEAFIDNPKCRNVINHKNGIKSDNRIENLEWVTSAENNAHAVNNFLRKTHNPKGITPEFIQRVINLRKMNFTNKRIAEIIGSTKCIIEGITSGRTHKTRGNTIQSHTLYGSELQRIF